MAALPRARAPRIAEYDLLRACGILLVVLAHARPPAALFHLRAFDVVLLVFVAGLSRACSSTRAGIGARLGRLVLPTWTFLAVYFGCVFAAAGLLGFIAPYSHMEVVSAFLFSHGWRYVWIVGVFAAVGLLTPLLVRGVRAVSNGAAGLGLAALVLALVELLAAVADAREAGLLRTALHLVQYGCVYALCFAFGLWFHDRPCTARHVTGFAVLLLAVAALVFLLDPLPLPQRFKYPPRALYFLYGIVCSMTLLFLARRWRGLAERLAATGFLRFVAANSLWVYFWHIPFSEWYRFHGAGEAGWAARFAVMLGAGSAMAALHIRVVRALLSASPETPGSGWKHWVRLALS